jgi:hypothetical protein
VWIRNQTLAFSSDLRISDSILRILKKIGRPGVVMLHGLSGYQPGPSISAYRTEKGDEVPE